MRFAAQRKSAPPLPQAGKLPYFNRELSWLAFDRRVLGLARSPDIPLLERLRFLAIVSSNLDEFFEIRVAGLIQQVESKSPQPGFDGLGPHEQLRRIHSVVASLVDDQYRCWRNELIPALQRQGIVFKTADQLTQEELRWVRRYFAREVFPVLTPLAVDPAHPFPQIGNKTLNIVAAIDYPETPEREIELAIVPVPRILPRVVEVTLRRSKTTLLIFLSEIIKLCIGQLFPGCLVTSAKAFRVTRNSDLYIDEEEAQNLLQTIEKKLRTLRRGAAVRLEVEEGVDERLFQALLDQVNLPNEYVFRINGPLNLMRLMSVCDRVARPELKFRRFRPVAHPELGGGTIFAEIARRDRLLHHPYDSFDPVVHFVTSAAHDPKVVAIKQTLYRTSGDSPVVKALIEASRQGKQVTALIELKARFDEANNIQWARQMEEAGVHVVYGIVGLKIHGKCCLVVRREGKKLRHYAHLGTGNYNPKTARLYTDFSLFTANRVLAEEVAQLFNTLTGFGRPHRFRHLLVAPFNLQTDLITMIEREIRHARAGRPARIIAQINSLIDKTMIDSLYAASHAGVRIDLVVRGICGLVPGIPGLSDRISVRSIVGRFLEHARVYYFENGGQPRIYLGSADWMQRNLYRRIEVVFPVLDPRLQQRLAQIYFPTLLSDNIHAEVLHPNGSYVRVDSTGDGPAKSAQTRFMQRHRPYSSPA